MVLLRLALEPDAAPTYAVLASELGLTASEIHAGLERATLAQLARKDQTGKPSVVREVLKLFVIHGARYAFPAVHGVMTGGLPTAYAAPPLKDRIRSLMSRPLCGRTRMEQYAGWHSIRCILMCRWRLDEVMLCMSS